MKKSVLDTVLLLMSRSTRQIEQLRNTANRNGMMSVKYEAEPYVLNSTVLLEVHFELDCGEEDLQVH